MVIVNEAKYRYGKEAGSFPIIKNTIFTGNKDKDKAIKIGLILFWIPFIALFMIISMLAGKLVFAPLEFGIVIFMFLVLGSKVLPPCVDKFYNYIDQSVQGDLIVYKKKMLRDMLLNKTITVDIYNKLVWEVENGKC